MKEAEVLRHIADNLENNRPIGHGLIETIRFEIPTDKYHLLEVQCKAKHLKDINLATIHNYRVDTSL